MRIKVIITGATGFVGEGVLLECLKHPLVKEVVMINRRHYPLKHPKLKELLVPDFFQIDELVNRLRGYNACFYCAGVSSIGMDEQKYTYLTFDTTLHFASLLSHNNPDMVFNFVSGRSTDNSGVGKKMWARVKGITENSLHTLPFAGQYNFRPGHMKPSKGQKNVKPFYKLTGIIWPLLFPKQSCTMHEVGLAMINVTLMGYRTSVLEVVDIRELAKYSNSY